MIEKKKTFTFKQETLSKHSSVIDEVSDRLRGSEKATLYLNGEKLLDPLKCMSDVYDALRIGRAPVVEVRFS